MSLPAPAATTESRGGVWSPAYRALTLGLVLTITLTAIEGLAVITILPLVKDDLGGLAYYGWVTSAFFLGTLVGAVIGGREADRRGPAPVYVVSLVLFAVGLAVGGLAPSMLVLVAGRAIQGLGAGAVPTIGYMIVARVYPESLRPRMFAYFSTAWVVPGLLGPGISVFVAERFGWRVVFLGILPLILLAGIVCLPAIRTVKPAEEADEAPSSISDAVRVALAVGCLLAGLEVRRPVASLLLVAAAVVIGVRPLARLLPPGTLVARPGLPATVAMRALVAFSFLGADAFIPLAITAGRGQPAALAGIAMTVASVTWTMGAWTQQWLAPRVSGRRLALTGLVIIIAGIGGEVLVLVTTVPPWIAAPAWGVGAYGIGIAYGALSVLTLAQAPEGREGRASAAMALADNLGAALGSGVAGVAVALGGAGSAGSASGLLAVFVITGAVALFALLLIPRVPSLVVPRH